MKFIFVVLNDYVNILTTKISKFTVVLLRGNIVQGFVPVTLVDVGSLPIL